MDIYEKLKNLKHNLKELGSVAVAFSGGVDSTFLLKVAHDVLKDNVIAVTAHSSTFPERELKEAVEFARRLGVKHVVIASNELDIEEFAGNAINRCYFCKKALFIKIHESAVQNNMKYVIDGSNVDDISDYRPGSFALEELKIVSPLKTAGMTKDDIRLLSAEMNLPTWDKPAFACLATRIPYGQNISKEKLDMIDRAEQYLLNMGFRQVRVRHHGDIARIEVAPGERSRFFNEGLMDEIHDTLKDLGFKYVTLDLKGYRMGSMNEGIS